MALSPKKKNEVTLQILYSFESGITREEEIIPFLMQQLKCTRKEVQEAYSLSLKIWEQKESIDSVIAKVSSSYDFKRIGPVEKCILRLTLFLQEDCSEALRLAKKFSGDSAASFIHAVLESVYGRSSLSPSQRESVS